MGAVLFIISQWIPKVKHQNHQIILNQRKTDVPYYFDFIRDDSLGGVRVFCSPKYLNCLVSETYFSS